MRLLSGLCIHSWLAFLFYGDLYLAKVSAEIAQRDIQKNADLSKVLLAPKVAKSLLRKKRGFWDSTNENKEKVNEIDRNAEFERACLEQCGGAWGHWTSCSVQCGSTGEKTRSRSSTLREDCMKYAAQCGSNTESQSCNRTCHNGGTLRKYDCSCRPGTKGRCCEHAETCTYPGKPEHGSVIPSKTSYPYGDWVSFACEPGYFLSSRVKRQCLGGSHWSNTAPTCTFVSCGDPGQIWRASRQGSSFSYGSTVAYRCQRGYTVQGSGTRTCQGNGHWSGTKPRCAIVMCPPLPVPTRGWRRMRSREPGAMVRLGCRAGYHVQGSTVRRCLPSGKWDGSQTVCKEIACDKLPSLSNGKVVQPDRPTNRALATFSCNTGYVLRGVTQRRCTVTRTRSLWSGDQPTCEAVKCNDPGSAQHASRQGNSFLYPNSVTYLCQPGYHFLAGLANVITCQANGQWSAGLPKCQACPLDHFKTGTDAKTECYRCPANSRTKTTASTQDTQCECDVGYNGLAGRRCDRVTCAKTIVPDNGQLGACQTGYNDTCVIDCNPGYVRSEGDAIRICGSDGKWTGADPVCKACPENTYRLSDTRCEKCPVHTHANTSGSDVTACLCDAGYDGPPGGPCTDVNECSVKNGRCAQTCINTPGSYSCSCSKAGFMQHPTNFRLCVAKNNCSDLDPPDNGGLVCVVEESTSTERCKVKCNYGYEHLVRPNEYEECGPDTEFKWSHDLSGTPILGCIAQFFPGVGTEADVAYFVDQCDSLSTKQKEDVKTQMLQILRDRGICLTSCKIDDVTIACGDIVDSDPFGRRKRSTVQKLMIKFKVVVPSTSKASVHCSACDRSSDESCNEQRCTSEHTVLATDLIKNTTAKLRRVFTMQHGSQRAGSPCLSANNCTNGHSASGNLEPFPTIKLGDKVLAPAAGLHTGNISSSCENGMVLSRDNCVPCPPGTYTDRQKQECKSCPPLTYQPLERQTVCLECLTANRNYTGLTYCPAPITPPANIGTTTSTASNGPAWEDWLTWWWNRMAQRTTHNTN